MGQHQGSSASDGSPAYQNAVALHKLAAGVVPRVKGQAERLVKELAELYEQEALLDASLAGHWSLESEIDVADHRQWMEQGEQMGQCLEMVRRALIAKETETSQALQELARARAEAAARKRAVEDARQADIARLRETGGEEQARTLSQRFQALPRWIKYVGTSVAGATTVVSLLVGLKDLMP